jgi:hypothetical protein
MSKAVPLIIIMLLVGVIVLWGALTGWTFSGSLPQEGAKCTPDEDSKDENATEYIYDADKKCLIVNACREGWEPDSSNSACIYSSPGVGCTPTGTTITNGAYTFDDEGACKLTSCENGFEMNLAKTACDTCKDGYIIDGEVCRSCTASDVTGVPAASSFDVIGQSYTTEDGKCVPKRIAYAGNDGTASCYAYCAGKKTGPWQGSGSMPSAWKGAKCVGVTKGTDHNTLNDTIKCETVRGKDNGNENLCICERSDFFRQQDTFEMPPGLTDDGDANMSKGWWGGPNFELFAGTVEDCAEQARALGVPAYGIRPDAHGQDHYKNTCFAYSEEWSGRTSPVAGSKSYTVCTDPTKRVKDGCV